MSGKEVSDAAAWFVREQIHAWLAKHEADGENATTLAAKIGVSKAQISDVKKQGRGVGLKTAFGMAKVLGFATMEELERVAAEAYKQRAGESSDVPPRPDIRIEYDERYPNMRVALEAVRGELHPKTADRVVHRVTTRVYHSKVDPPVSHWVREIMDVDRDVRWEASNPAGAAALEDASRARTAAVIAEQNAKSTEAASKIPGLEGPESLGPAPPKRPKKPKA